MAGKRGQINPMLGITDGRFNSMIRSSLRKIWGYTSRAEFIKSVRVPNTGTGRHKFVVVCNECGREMKLNEKEYRKRKDGTYMTKPKIVYEVDHVTENPPLHLGNVDAFINNLFFGEMRILCWQCHDTKTHKRK